MMRRATIRVAMAGAAAAIAAPAVAQAAGNPEARFIAECDEYVAATRAEYASFKTIRDDDERDIAMAANRARQEALIDRISSVEQIRTPEGARAAARVILASSIRAADGDFAPDTLEEAVAVTLAKYMTGGVDPMEEVV